MIYRMMAGSLMLLFCSLSGISQVSATMEKTMVVGNLYPYELKPVKNISEAGVTNPASLAAADAMVYSAINAGAFPGCRIVAARDGKVFYDKSFGNLTYGGAPVTSNTVYDLASLTKVVSTTLAVMRLYEQGRLSLDKTLGDYLPITAGTDKAGIQIRNLLLHQAGLKAWIPFYRSFIDSTGGLLDTAFRSRPDARYNIEVARNLYLRKDYRDSIWQTILTSPLDNRGRMVYSDLDFYFLAAVVEKITGKPIDRYVSAEFYIPMGLKTMGYNPLKIQKGDHIAATENDLIFRRQVLQGYVHDPGAALFGGVAGHAGVFGSALDVAAVFQMLLNYGTYKGKQYFKKQTVEAFTAYGSSISRRGLGFDKPDADRRDAGPAGNRVSGYTFGHQGFTGTCAWADPVNGVVYVFLSNRVYPDQENNLLARMGTRTLVQDTLYHALGIPPDVSRPDVKAFQLETGKYE